MKDVALLAGVHVTTASRALSAEHEHRVSAATRARVRAAAESLGYRTNAVARSLRMGATGAIGVVVADLTNPFIVPFLRGVEREARMRGVTPLMAESHDDPERMRRVVTRMARNQVDAIILSAAHRGDHEFVTAVADRLPVVLAVSGLDRDDPEGDDSIFQVLHDDELGGRLAAAHLLELGHRRIGQVGGPLTISSFVGRRAGFADALDEHPSPVIPTEEFGAESSAAEGYRIARTLLRGPAETRPTALFAHNDLMAVGVLEALAYLQLACPGDVSVVGYNDAPLSEHIDPPLTTVRLPSFNLGRYSARTAIDALGGALPHGRSTMLPPEFVTRASTRALTGGG